MADPDDCHDCSDPERGRVKSPPFTSRAEALSLYIRLQGQGFLPTLCENRQGVYRVCHTEKSRIGK